MIYQSTFPYLKSYVEGIKPYFLEHPAANLIIPKGILAIQLQNPRGHTLRCKPTFGSFGSVTEHLLSMLMALGLIPQNLRRKKTKQSKTKTNLTIWPSAVSFHF
jgi:hypothetical protein